MAHVIKCLSMKKTQIGWVKEGLAALKGGGDRQERKKVMNVISKWVVMGAKESLESVGLQAPYSGHIHVMWKQ